MGDASYRTPRGGMMKTRWAFVMIGVVMIVALGCAKREGTTAPVAQSSGPGSASALVSTTATVEDVDQRTRMVTLRTADGEIVHFQGDESMRNLPQVRKGDQVTATYYESIALRLREAEGEQPRIAVSEQVERAPLGEKPAGMVVRNATLTAKVAAIDRARETVTLEGPQGGKITLKVQDPANLERAHVGHLVEATYREAVSISVLAFHHAEHGGGSPYYLASALYAWAYLFPADGSAAPDVFDPRGRLACELYNRGLTEGLKRGDDVELRAGSYPLPFGTLDVTLDPAALSWSGHQLSTFFPLAELEVKGFPTYYRWAGLGAPLAAGLAPNQGRDRDLLARRAQVPVTAVLRPADLAQQLGKGHVRAALELYPGYGDQTITVGNRHVPLEAEPTAALAFSLARSAIWERETAGFLRGAGVIEERARLVSTRPYSGWS